jgi:hypothetical protein
MKKHLEQIIDDTIEKWMYKDLTDKEVKYLNFLLSNPTFYLISNEDISRAWIADHKTKKQISFNSYLKFVYQNKIVCFRSDIDHCIFWFKAQDEANPWPNGIITFMPEKGGLYDVMTINGDVVKAFCSHNTKGEMVWIFPTEINIWRDN